MTPELQAHCLRNVAEALRDIARRDNPDLTFDTGTVDGGGFRLRASRVYKEPRSHLTGATVPTNEGRIA